jgi:transposase
MLVKIRRRHIREKLSIRDIARRTNLSRNTIRQWLKSPEMSEPKYPERWVTSVVDPYSDQLRSWLQTDSHRPKRDHRTAKIMFEAIRAQRYAGSYVRVCVRIRKLRQELGDAPHRSAFVPLSLARAKHSSLTGAASTPGSAACGGVSKSPTASWSAAGHSGW